MEVWRPWTISYIEGQSGGQFDKHILLVLAGREAHRCKVLRRQAGTQSQAQVRWHIGLKLLEFPN